MQFNRLMLLIRDDMEAEVRETDFVNLVSLPRIRVREIGEELDPVHVPQASHAPALNMTESQPAERPPATSQPIVSESIGSDATGRSDAMDVEMEAAEPTDAQWHASPVRRCILPVGTGSLPMQSAGCIAPVVSTSSVGVEFLPMQSGGCMTPVVGTPSSVGVESLEMQSESALPMSESMEESPSARNEHQQTLDHTSLQAASSSAWPQSSMASFPMQPTASPDPDPTIQIPQTLEMGQSENQEQTAPTGRRILRVHRSRRHEDTPPPQPVSFTMQQNPNSQPRCSTPIFSPVPDCSNGASTPTNLPFGSPAEYQTPINSPIEFQSFGTSLSSLNQSPCTPRSNSFGHLSSGIGLGMTGSKRSSICEAAPSGSSQNGAFNFSVGKHGTPVSRARTQRHSRRRSHAN